MHRINHWFLLATLCVVAGISIILCTAAGPAGFALPGSMGTDGGVSSLILTQIRLLPNSNPLNSKPTGSDYPL